MRTILFLFNLSLILTSNLTPNKYLRLMCSEKKRFNLVIVCLFSFSFFSISLINIIWPGITRNVGSHGILLNFASFLLLLFKKLRKYNKNNNKKNHWHWWNIWEEQIFSIFYFLFFFFCNVFFFCHLETAVSFKDRQIIAVVISDKCLLLLKAK